MSAIQTSEVMAARPGAVSTAWTEKRWVVVAIYATLCAIALYPIFSVTVPPLVDYPNHLARMHILAHAELIPALRQNYIVNGRFHPNMAMELVVPVLARFMSIYMAGKVFIALTLLALLGGTIALRKVLCGRVGLWPVLTFLLLYSHILFWGFLDYLFTAGLALLAFSAWIALRGRGPLLRTVIFSGAAFALFVAHLFGLFVYGLMVLGYEIWRVRDYPLFSRPMISAWVVSGLQFAAPVALFLYWMSANSPGGPALTAYGGINLRFIGLISPVFVGLPWIDFPTAAFLAFVFALCRRNPHIGLAPAMKPTVLVMTAAALLVPYYLAGVWGTHFRIPTLIGCVLVAGIRVAPEARRFATTLLAAAAAMFTIRTAVIAYSWADFDRKFMEFRAASAVIAAGSRIFAIEDEEDLPAGRLPVYGMQFWNLSALAVIERSAFTPTLFTGHVGVTAAPRVRRIDTPTGTPLPRDILRDFADPAHSRFPLGYHLERYVWVYWTGWPTHYDYAVAIRFANASNPDPAHLQRVARGSFFDIYRVAAPSPPTPTPGQ